MKASEQVGFLEDEVKAFEEMYRKEIEKELANTGIYLHNLTCYDYTSSSLENHFYPMAISKTERQIGLIIPFRRLIFHSLHGASGWGMAKDKEIFEALANLSDRRGYHLEYYEFAWQHEPVIDGIREGKLPAIKPSS